MPRSRSATILRCATNPSLSVAAGAASFRPPEVTTKHIYLGVIPFVLIQLAALVALWFVPALATALPHALYGG